MKKLLLLMLITGSAMAPTISTATTYPNFSNMDCGSYVDAGKSVIDLVGVWLSGFITAKNDRIDEEKRIAFVFDVTRVCQENTNILLLDAAKATYMLKDY